MMRSKLLLSLFLSSVIEEIESDEEGEIRKDEREERSEKHADWQTTNCLLSEGFYLGTFFFFFF